MSKFRFNLVLCVALVIAGCTFTQNRQVELRPEHLACKVDEDCTYAHIACSSCGTSVARAHAAALSAAADDMCKGYRGPVVDCISMNPPRCKAGTCSITPDPWDPEY